ncbi:hypothetical protein SAMN05444411_107100 [Lutibacter oricola]|uniref:Tellurite resistance protein TerB n=1 Tax=Lutibacter oricola TaxID=762486 RepID=A0A1H3DB40_9FLAO|nr:hypothetical protein [Lutibacter oricola]SDX63577.1 hypothetical protein SAMN05444411_107100 [Lutibacter oricola]
MSISDLYPTGLHERNIGHFAAIVRLALRDNKIDDNEAILLNRLARRLNITKNEFKAILSNPARYPISCAVNFDDRLERLFDLTKMLFIDRKLTVDKASIMNRIAIGLGFPVEKAKVVVKAAIQFFIREPEMDDFKREIRNVC